MSRYLAYLILINMVANVLLYVPTILIEYRIRGSVAAVLLSVVIGTMMMTLFVKGLEKFPGKSFTEIMKFSFTNKLNYAIVPLISTFWLIAGLITILSYTNINIRYFNPEIPPIASLVLFLVFCLTIMLMPSRKVLYFIEIMVLISLPFIIVVFYKAVSDKHIQWDSIRIVLNTWNQLPNAVTIAAASYVFTGYINLVIFSKMIKTKLKAYQIMLVASFGLANLMMTFLTRSVFTA